ncbi:MULTISPECIES: hypothetical protein [unclassified Coleofasciculus]|uniref:hypothetical protein n=1 Tax=unclassified Coleofasciculus TaxID=2692782 RepID=UPI00187F5675|nr:MULTISPECIES: hypothetical protein [unclassified Coleofasciculus]MBE9127705.1 hypothetical protein [Coleofasciculus sp. LEGE 07081]MBE9149705.1 hypothetical protein [Coleofasciculus sp. LEGE 07092]
MALEPCKVCGSLTSTNEEICMICGYPAQGRPKSVWFKWIALILAVIIGLPVVIGVIQTMGTKDTPVPPLIEEVN